MNFINWVELSRTNGGSKNMISKSSSLFFIKKSACIFFIMALSALRFSLFSISFWKVLGLFSTNVHDLAFLDSASKPNAPVLPGIEPTA